MRNFFGRRRSGRSSTRRGGIFGGLIEQTGYFFNSVMNNLRTQAEGTRQVTRQLADQ